MPNTTIASPTKELIFQTKKIRYRSNGIGPALLLLHSAWGDAELSWAPVWDGLTSSFSVIAPDMPGFGLSEPLDKPTLAGNARVLKELLDDQKVERAIIVGNSFGATIAIEFASIYPERTARLVLVNGGYLPQFPGFIRKLISLPAVEKRFRAFMRKLNYSDKAFAKAFPNPMKLTPQFFDRIRANEETQSRVVADTFLNQTIAQPRPKVPSAMIWGTGDNLVTMKQACIIRKWLGDPDFLPIEGAGHLPQAEEPEAFVTAMKKVAEINDREGLSGTR